MISLTMRIIYKNTEKRSLIRSVVTFTSPTFKLVMSKNKCFKTILPISLGLTVILKIIYVQIKKIIWLNFHRGLSVSSTRRLIMELRISYHRISRPVRYGIDIFYVICRDGRAKRL